MVYIADYKAIEASKLFELLQPTDTLVVNTVGNLSVIRDGKYAGFVDFGIEEFVEVEDGDTERRPGTGYARSDYIPEFR